MALVYSVVDKCPSLEMLTLVSKNGIEVSLASNVNLMDLWNWFSSRMKVSKSSRLWGQIMKMSSIYCSHVSGFRFCVFRKSVSKFVHKDYCIFWSHFCAHTGASYL